jgi:homoserine O-acetyltransferase
VEEALHTVTARSLVLGIDSDRLFPVDGQQRIARSLPNLIDDEAIVLASDFGHDGFLIETDEVGMHLGRLLEA